jgi:hypothetical protein
MTPAIRISLASILLVAGLAADAACVYPQAPQDIPNGAAATKEQMLEAQAKVKEYSSAVQDTYLPCLDTELAEQIASLDPADPDHAQKELSLKSIQAKKHNAALDELTALAGRWSDEIKAFNKANDK